MQHTQGKWTLDETGTDVVEINCETESGWKAIATVSANDLGSETVDPDEMLANARLIMAAPALLAACQRVLRLTSCLALHSSTRDAIKLATGD